jgi:arginine-tRNA-protein transferase
VYSLLAELRVGAQLGLAFHYLGYWVAACGSMAYKSRYQPHQLLREYVADDQTPEWQAPR